MSPEHLHARRWSILGVLVVSLLVVGLDNTILNVALPTIQHDLNASQSAQEWIVDSYVLVFAGLLFTAGVLGDRFGRKLMLLGGLAVFGVGSVASAFAGTAGQLIGTRALMGIGGAAIMPSTLSIITNVFEPAERGRAIGIWAGVSGLGIAIGPLAGGALLAHFWWGSVFLVNVPVVIAGLVAGWLLVPESKDPAPQRIDLPGVLLSVAGLTALVYGIIKGGSENTFTIPQVWVPLAASVLLLTAFALVEWRSDHPALDVTLFRNRSFSAASAAVTLVFFALFGATFFLTFYWQFARGYSPLDAGIRLIPVAAALTIWAPRSAKFVERFGPKVVCAVGLGLVGTSFLLYQLVDVHTNIWALEGLLFLLGTGMGNTIAPATTAIMATLPRERAGAGSAVNNTVRQVGGALGVAVLGSLLSASYRGRVEPLLSALPAAARKPAGESLGATLEAAHRAGGPALQIVDPAKSAFIHALHVGSLGSALVAFLGCLVVVLWLPGRVREVALTGQPAQMERHPAHSADLVAAAQAE